MTGQALQSLENPGIRLPLRADFPRIICLAEQPLLPVVQAELEKCGESLETVDEINLVCPQKDPELFPGHLNVAVSVQRVAARKLRREFAEAGFSPSHLRLVKQNAICETRYLNRSRRTGIIFSLTESQVFKVNAQRYTVQPTKFLCAKQTGRRHFFILIDKHVESGTTLANLASYITHNGGHVLAAASLFHACPLAPSSARERELFPDMMTKLPFADLAEHLGVTLDTPERKAQAAIGYLAALAALRSKEVKNPKVEGSFNDIEKLLNGMGHSLWSMTAGEVSSLMRNLDRDVRYESCSTVKILREIAQKGQR